MRRARSKACAAEYGDEPRLQAQCVPLSAAGKIDPSPAAPAAPAVIAPPARRLSGAEIRHGGQNILAAAKLAAAPSPKQIRR